MKKYLVTGGAGFIGSNFIRYLFDKYGNEVFVVNLDKLTYAGNLNNLKAVENNPNHKLVIGDICDNVLVKSLFNEYNFDYVVNFAAESDVDKSFSGAEEFLRTNVLGTLNLLNCARECWIKDGKQKNNVKFLQISSDEVYGMLGLDDSQFFEYTPLNPQNPYAVTKATADIMVKQFYTDYGLPINISRCSNNFGPNQHTEKLIPLTISKCFEMQNIPIHGTGENIRDWIYVSDHCNAIDLILTKGEIGEVYNIGAHNEKQNIQVVKDIIKYLKANYNSKISNKLIEYITDRKVNDLRYSINYDKISTELGYAPAVSYIDGLKLTIDWYIANIDWLKTIK